MTSPSPVSGWEAERERLMKALEAARQSLEIAGAFIADEYRDPAAEVDGEWLSSEARRPFHSIADALSAIDAALQAPEQPEADGWVEWKGGETRPKGVTGDMLVEVRFPGGETDIAKAALWYWDWTPSDTGGPRASDIIAWRPAR